jgi:hypothetical protein
MKIRLMGLPVEVAAAETVLRTAPGLVVVSVDGPYPNRAASREVRVYVGAMLTAPLPATDGRAGS